MLVTSPGTVVEDTVFAAVRDLLLHLLKTQQGEVVARPTAEVVLNFFIRRTTEAYMYC